MPDPGPSADAADRSVPGRRPVLEAVTSGPDETRALAASLARLVDDGDLIVLTGDLGAGKTCFTQGLGLGLDVPDRITSPTFTLLVEHEGRLPLHHLDAYRLDGIDQAADLDLPELLERGVTVIEWGDRLAAGLPADQLHIELRLGPGDDDRRLLIEPRGAAWARRHDELERALGPWVVAC